MWCSSPGGTWRAATLANAYLEGRYSRCIRHLENVEGLRKFFSQFSFRAASAATARLKRPARSTRAASWVRVSHAFGAAFDNPDLIVAAVVGDGEAKPDR